MMPSVNVILAVSGFVTLDGSGNGTVKLGPISAREVWHPATVHVQASTNVKEATCTIFCGDRPVTQNYRDATFSGSSGDSSSAVAADVIKCSQYVFGVWSGGDTGAVATLNVTGTKDV